MEIKGVKATRKTIKCGASLAVITFSSGAHVVSKDLRISSAMNFLTLDDFFIAAKIQIRKAIREAERDLAYAEYGEDWISHVPRRGSFLGPTTEDEARMISLVLERIVEDLLQIPNVEDPR